MKTFLVTGGLGFIGSNFIKYILERRSDILIINVDSVTYAANPSNIPGDLPGYRFYKTDIADKNSLKKVFEENKIDFVINFAAESHVDRSIMDPGIFVKTNVLGTLNLLKMSLDSGVSRFLQVSTDEVYGSLGSEGKFNETTPLSPRSPYSASKASADMIVNSFYHTYGLPVLISRCSNNYGPLQFPEKLIPLTIINALNGKDIPVYGDGRNVRDWIYVEDHVRGILSIIENGRVGEAYNLGGDSEEENINIIKYILDILGKPYSLIKFVKDRPGHDRRYAMDFTKASRELGFMPEYNFKKGLELTIGWYLDNKIWWQELLSEDYKKYYKEMYENR